MTIEYTFEEFPVALKRKEAIVEKGLKEAGAAFDDIRKCKLYKITYPGKTFAEYCKLRWKMSPRTMYYIFARQKVESENVHTCAQIPTSALGRHIARLPESQQQGVIEQLTADGHSPTVQEVKKAVDQKLGIKRKLSIPKDLKQELEKTGVCPLCQSRIHRKIAA